MSTEEFIEVKGLEPVVRSIIMVAGVGGAGGNAVNHMYDLGITDVTFMVANTDRQALGRSLVPLKVQLGEGLGAGNKPEEGRRAAIASIDEITDIFREQGTKMVFVTAGMGGGTGTGAAPIIAKAARDMGLLTVGIVTMPYISEGPMRVKNAMEGIEQLKKNVDSLLIINNENIQEIYGELPITEAFGKANDILATAAKGIAEIVTVEGVVNVDFADVTTVMKESGVALMGSARASGEDRVEEVVQGALTSPLLNYNSIEGATSILFNIASGTQEVTLAESAAILDMIQARAGKNANVIWGITSNELLGDEIELTVIATGFGEMDDTGKFQPIASGKKNSWAPPRNPFEKAKPLPEDASNNIIEVAENTRYRNIEHVLGTPAYVRRRVKLSSDGGGTRANVKLTDAAPKKEEGKSLFE
jgi:cell division protein FtsZ